MKKEWITPSCTVECFEANEYVAVCWGLECVGGKGTTGSNPVPETKYGSGHWNGSETSGEHDHTGSCTDIDLNRITEVNKTLTFQENNSEQGWISGSIDSFVDTNGNGTIDAGELVYWHTNSADGKRQWNHAGYAVNVSASHPNHS